MSEPAPDLVPFHPIEEAAPEATAFECPLCGGRFSHGTLVCGACPQNAGCEVIKCPSCGYQFPRRSRIVDIVKRWVGGPASR